MIGLVVGCVVAAIAFVVYIACDWRMTKIEYGLYGSDYERMEAKMRRQEEVAFWLCIVGGIALVAMLALGSFAIAMGGT